jgi:hypothetical protein
MSARSLASSSHSMIQAPTSEHFKTHPLMTLDYKFDIAGPLPTVR